MKTINKLTAILFAAVLLCTCTITLTVCAADDPTDAWGIVNTPNGSYNGVVIKGKGDDRYIFSTPNLDDSDSCTFTSVEGKNFKLEFEKTDKEYASVLKVEKGDDLKALKLSTKYDKDEIAVLYEGVIYSGISVVEDKKDTLTLEGVPVGATSGAAIINSKNDTVIAIVYQNDGMKCSAVKADYLEDRLPGKISTLAIVLIVIGGVAVVGGAGFYFLRSKGMLNGVLGGKLGGGAPAGVPNGMQGIPGQPVPPVQNAAFRTRVCIRGETGYFAGKKFELDGSVTMGRQGERCNICYPSDAKGISGLHCKLRPAGSQIELVDLGSSFGTFVNGQPIIPNTPFILNPGDRFWLASEANTFVVYQ